MEDCEEAKMCLGLEKSRKRSKRILTITQENYASKILDCFGLTFCKSAPTPMAYQLEGEIINAEQFDSTKYRQATGSSMYLVTYTRPDISVTVGRLSQYMEKPLVAL